MDNEKKARIVIFLDPWEKEALKEYARENEWKLAGYIRRTVRLDYEKENQHTNLRAEGIKLKRKSEMESKQNV